MRKDIHKVEVHGVDERCLVHPNTTLLKGLLLCGRVIRLHDELKCTRHLLLVLGGIDVLQDLKELR